MSNIAIGFKCILPSSQIEGNLVGWTLFALNFFFKHETWKNGWIFEFEGSSSL